MNVFKQPRSSSSKERSACPLSVACEGCAPMPIVRARHAPLHVRRVVYIEWYTWCALCAMEWCAECVKCDQNRSTAPVPCQHAPTASELSRVMERSEVDKKITLVQIHHRVPEDDEFFFVYLTTATIIWRKGQNPDSEQQRCGMSRVCRSTCARRGPRRSEAVGGTEGRE
jgi:hypothetical protein